MSVAAPRRRSSEAQSARARKYPPRVAEFARRLGASGYTIAQIQAEMAKHGYRPSRDTVMRWVDADYAETRRMAARRFTRRQRTPNWQRRLAQCHEWRAIGLAYTAIAKLIAYEWGIELSEGQVRAFLKGRSSEAAIRVLLTGERPKASGVKA